MYRRSIGHRLIVEQLEERCMFVVVADNPALHLTPPGQFLGAASLFDVAPFEQGVPLNCTGTLLPTGRHVLTAGHCLGLTPSDDLQDVVFTGFQPIRTVRAFVHPTYLNNSRVAQQGHDLAILELPSLAHASIPRHDIFRASNEIGQVLNQVGYGRTGTGLTGQTTADGLAAAQINCTEFARIE